MNVRSLEETFISSMALGQVPEGGGRAGRGLTEY